MNTANIRLKSLIISGIREYFENKGFWEIFPTRIGNIALASDACNLVGLYTLGKDDNTKQNMYLSQTAQLVLEQYAMSLPPGVCGCFSIAPCYRYFDKENVDAMRLSEYWQLEAEWKVNISPDNIDEVKAMCTSLFRYLIKYLEDKGEFPDLKKDAIDDFQFIPGEPDWLSWNTKNLEIFRKGKCEIFSASVRKDNISQMKAKLSAEHIEMLTDYFLLKEVAADNGYTTVGFGMGIERLMMYLCRKSRIVEVCDADAEFSLSRRHVFIKPSQNSNK